MIHLITSDMNSKPKIKSLGKYRQWEPIILKAYVEETGTYTIRYSIGNYHGQETQRLTVGDALVFSNTLQRKGEIALSALLPTGDSLQDAEGHTYFTAEVG
jgi:hypothetical protein